MSNLEGLRRHLQAEGAKTQGAKTEGAKTAGWRTTVGARVSEVELGHVSVELDADERHQHEWGMVQGGIVTAVADAAMGLSSFTTQPQGEANVTVELKINFVRPMVKGRMRARGRALHREGDLLFSEAEVFDGEDRLVAVATSTCMAISGSPFGS